MLKLRNIMAVILSLFGIYTAIFGVFADIIQRGTVLSLAMIIIYLNSIGRKKENRLKYLLALDTVLLIVSVVSITYLVLTFETVATRYGAISSMELLIGIALIVVLLEATRKTTGMPIVCIAIFFLMYAYFGQYFPGGLWHRGYSIERIVSHLCVGSNGIFGIPMGTAATLVIMFTIFGSFLENSGGGKFFMEFATALTGRTLGGPAKAAVVSSALMGTVSGAAATNVVTTGTFTIPLMIRVGYKNHIAGAVEAVASTGGQLMPPVMGAAAFIMAELLGMPYRTIAIAAVIPSLLYYITLFVMVHIEAEKTGIKGLSDDEIPNLKTVLHKDGHTFLPVVILVILIVLQFSPMYAALFGTLSALASSWLRRHTRMNIYSINNALINAANNMLAVATACASAGIVIGVISLTGLGLKISSLVITLSGGNLLIALILTFIALLILGMGMPTAAAYILVATLVTPALTDMGVMPLAAHMFVFYGAILSAITPPVALAAYAASGLAKADPMKIAVSAVKMGIVAFIIPFFFVYQPALLCQGEIPEIFFSLVSGIIGCVTFSIGIQGFLFQKKIFWVNRILITAGALMLIYPGVTTDLIGFTIIIASVVGTRYFKLKNIMPK